ncbi:hypothetical protein Tco_0132634 [Tanacetum coccineum]
MSYLQRKKWWSKKANVIPRGLAWSKVTMFEKSDYEELFGPMSNPNVPLIASPKEMSHAWFKDIDDGDGVLDSHSDDGDGVLDSQTKDVIEEASMLPTMSLNSPQVRNAAVSKFFAEFDALKKEVLLIKQRKDDEHHPLQLKPGNNEDVSHLADNMEIDGPNVKDLYSNSQHHLHLLIKGSKIIHTNLNNDV